MDNLKHVNELLAKKTRKTTRVNLDVDTYTLACFKNICEREGVPMTKVLRALMKDFVEQRSVVLVFKGATEEKKLG